MTTHMVLIHDCHKIKGKTRFMGVAVVTLTEILTSPNQLSQSKERIDQSDPVSQVGKRKA